MAGEANGHHKVEVRMTRIGYGYVTFHTEPLEGEHSPLCISSAINEWVAANESVRVRSLCPIVKNGNTVLVHIFYDGIEERVLPSVVNPPWESYSVDVRK